MEENELLTAQTAVAKEEETLAIPPEEEHDESEALSSHPLFERFAKDKGGSREEILSDFREMLTLLDDEKQKKDAAIGAMMTPPARCAIPDVALSERQKMIARAAGMTYQEYFELYGTVKGLR